MSTSSRVITGLTLEIETNLGSTEFKKWHAFEDKHPELDEYNYDHRDREGRLLLIGDGMSGDFLRLVKIDKLREGASLGDEHVFLHLNMPEGVLSQDLVSQMSEIYKEYTG
jgi:hypothetical protein